MTINNHSILAALLFFSIFFNSSCTDNYQKGSSAKEYFNKAYQFIDAGYPQDAIELLNLAIEKDPKYIDAYYNRGVLYFTLKNYQQAITNFSKVIELNPKHAEAYFNRGHMYERLNNYPQAISDYKTAAILGDKVAQDYLKTKGITW